jgi:hypothetical protein
MEQANWENEIQNRKKAYQAGIMRHNEKCDQSREDIRYTESRRLWGEFKKGNLTAEGLKNNLQRFIETETAGIELGLIKDVFSAKEI